MCFVSDILKQFGKIFLTVYYWNGKTNVFVHNMGLPMTLQVRPQFFNAGKATGCDCRFTSTPHTAKPLCQCSCNVPQKQFHKCCSWKGCADNISSAPLDGSLCTHSHHQQPYSFTRALTQKPKYSADDHSATLVNNTSPVPLDLVSGLVWLFWSLMSAGWFTN